MDQENRLKWIALLEKHGCKINVTLLACTITRGGFYIIKPTFEAALLDYIEMLHKTEKQLRQWKDDWMPIVMDWSEHH